ncbi:MAG: hypothetical protein ACRDV9_08835 [Acidimicrobiia bacterium]
MNSVGLVVVVVLLVPIGRIAMLLMRNLNTGSNKKNTSEMVFWATMTLVGLVAVIQFSSCCEVGGC